MTGAPWQRISELLEEALEHRSDTRADFLDGACGADSDLRAELDSLLEAHGASGPVDELASSLMEPLISCLEPPLKREGKTVAHYEVIRRLSGGGMGVVYRARDTRLGRQVALKFPLPQLRSVGAARERFIEEARTAAALDHPNICTIHEIGETGDGRLFIAMPLYEGETLDALLSRGALELPVAVDFAAQLARGLAKAHERGIIHRDVKPANVLITADGILKILDFGIATLAEAAPAGAEAVIGTPSYMSPEQASGGPVDRRADLWSLGVVLFEMVTGELPFHGADTEALLRAVRTTTIAPMSALRTGVPEELDRVGRKALARDRDARYASAPAMLEDLCRIPAGGVGLGTHPGPRGDAGQSIVTISVDGERRYAVIVVCRLVSYESLFEHLASEEADALLHMCAAAANEIAGRHGGTALHRGEDRLVMAFGVPVTHEDDAVRALRAARELHARVREIVHKIGPTGGLEVHLQSGISAGLISARRPSPGDREFRIAGEAVELAGRLSDLAAADEILITPKVGRLSEPLFALEPGAPVALPDGRSMTPCRLGEEIAHEDAPELIGTGGSSAFVGREREVKLLEERLADAQRGNGGLVTIEGEAGVGKSRLLTELRERAKACPLTVLGGRCHSYGARVPYLPFVGMLRRRLDGGGEATELERAQGIRARLESIDPGLVELLPFYLHLLQIHSDSASLPRELAGDEFRLLLSEAICGFVAALAGRQPVVVLLEDWHWADEDSRAACAQLAQLASDRSVLVLVTHRPTPSPTWQSVARHTHLRLDPLDLSASTTIMKSAFEAERVDEGLALRIYDGTGGNPFFLEEICRAMLDRGAIQVRSGKAALREDGERVLQQQPDTVQAVIRSRLDLVSAGDRDVLKVAAVIGREFSRRLLVEILGAGVSLLPGLRRLQAADLIRQAGVVPDPTFRFKHVLTQEVAYAGLVQRERKLLHERVGSAIETLHAGRLEEYCDLLLHHYLRAENWGKAVAHALVSATRAEELSSVSRALETLENAGGWLARLPDGPEKDRLGVQVLLGQERLQETLGRRDRQQELIDGLKAIVERGEETPDLAEVYLRQGDLDLLQGHNTEAGRALARALEVATRLDDRHGIRKALRSLGLLRWRQDRYREALDAAERALAIDRELGDPYGHALGLTNYGNMLIGIGEIERARALVEEVREVLDRMESPRRKHLMYHLLGTLQMHGGEEEEAVRMFQEASRLAVENRQPLAHSHDMASMAHLRFRQGKIEESLKLYREAVALARTGGHADRLSVTLRMVGDVCAVLDRPAEALPYFSESAGLLAQLGDRRAEADVQASIAAAQESGENLPEARKAWIRARELYEQTGDAPDVVRALEALARLARLESDREGEALALLLEASDLAHTLDDRSGEGRLRNTIGILLWQEGRYAEALEQYERALGLLDGAGTPAERAVVLASIGVTLGHLGREAEALGRLERALDLARQAGERGIEGRILGSIGDSLLEAVDFARAAEHYERSRVIRRETGDRVGEGWMLHHLARASFAAGAVARGREYRAQARRIGEECQAEELLQACRRLEDTG